ncbi:MAG: branched-chain amino acid ABC transporter permease [Magnetovibrio sp.]|nr:branched-chain amino acid ABC transporter permease [Magnetovibrio sp.]
MKHSNKTSPDTSIAGAVAIIPMLLGTAPFGVIFGAFAVEMGLGHQGGQSMSLFVFAGSAQFVGASLYGQGVSLLVVAITTFFINLRHTLYGASLGPKLLSVSPRQRLLMAFFLTDETFSIVSRFRIVRPRYYWGAALSMYINWQVWTFVGLISGSYIREVISVNLAFVMVPAFLAIITSHVNSVSSTFCALSAMGISVLLFELPHQLGLMVAGVTAIVLTLLFEKLTSSRSSATNKAKQ